MVGVLGAVCNLTSVSTPSAIQLSWLPPFSLNLTTAEPDIVFCVDIFNITDHTNADIDHLVSDCSVIEAHYKFNIDNSNIDAEDLFKFVVTPRSNVEGARNGTPSNINVSYSFQSKLHTCNWPDTIALLCVLSQCKLQ